MKTDKPWGYEILNVNNGKYVVKTLFMKSGHSCSLQYHEKKDETLIVHSGKLKLYVSPNISIPLEEKILNSGDVYNLPTGTIHKCEAFEVDCLYFEASTIELDDVIRLKDNYGRV
jgi:mannose-6-phosphate isomerase